MLKIFISVIVIAAVISSNGIDVAGYVTTEQFKCLRSNGIGTNYVAIRGISSFGAVEPTINTTMDNAANADISFVDPYVQLCRGKSGKSQVNDFFDYLGDAFISYVWVNVESNPSPGCSWASYSFAQNCAFLDEVATTILNRGGYPGFYTSSAQWAKLFGTECTKFHTYPLWYAHDDDSEAYDDFVPFGGWSTPSRKQYKTGVQACGIQVNLDWYHQC